MGNNKVADDKNNENILFNGMVMEEVSRYIQ